MQGLGRGRGRGVGGGAQWGRGCSATILYPFIPQPRRILGIPLGLPK